MCTKYARLPSKNPTVFDRYRQPKYQVYAGCCSFLGEKTSKTRQSTWLRSQQPAANGNQLQVAADQQTRNQVAGCRWPVVAASLFVSSQ
uniref:Uncharacterized protein n=1 Tax=Romanomermis culicivorax TaxID=13658 RepID=A0A915IE22_ROMCU